MPWQRRLLTVYHGTVGPYADDIRDNGIQLARCSLESDFGRGFYTTRILGQAIEFANERFRQMTKDHARHPSVYPDPQHAAVLEFSIVLDALGSLETLAFVQPTDDWLDFIGYCRIPGGSTHKANGNYYDAVYGPVWRSGADAHPSWEQLSFHNDYPVRTLLTLQVPILRGGPEL
jgi:hypothetical protein